MPSFEMLEKLVCSNWYREYRLETIKKNRPVIYLMRHYGIHWFQSKWERNKSDLVQRFAMISTKAVKVAAKYLKALIFILPISLIWFFRTNFFWILINVKKIDEKKNVPKKFQNIAKGVKNEQKKRIFRKIFILFGTSVDLRRIFLKRPLALKSFTSIYRC